MNNECKVLTIEPAKVLHCDFTVSPDGRNHDVQFLAPEAPESRTQILAVDDVAQDTLVHVKDNCKGKKTILKHV